MMRNGAKQKRKRGWRTINFFGAARTWHRRMGEDNQAGSKHGNQEDVMKISALCNGPAASGKKAPAQLGYRNLRTVFLAGLLSCTLLAASPSTSCAQAGRLDPTFGSGGEVTTIIGPSPGLVSVGMALQKDGKIVVAGGAGRDFVLARYNPNGALDPTFGTGGIVRDKLGYISAADAVAIQTDGKILAAGTDPLIGGIILARFNSNGTLDMTFGNSGATTSQGLGSAIMLQPDGKILVAGGQAIVRFNQQGALDSTFGTGGFAPIVQPGGGTSFRFQSTGKILVAGGGIVSRYNPNGSLDAGFGILGSTGSVPTASAVAVRSDDSIVAAGAFTERVSLPNFIADADLAVVHYSSEGVVDDIFGTRGVGLADFLKEPSSASASAVAVQSDNKIVAAGQVSEGSNPPQFAVARFTTAGALDLTFGNHGTVVTDLGGGGVNALVLQPDGKIVVAGSFDGGGSTLFALARYTAK